MLGRRGYLFMLRLRPAGLGGSPLRIRLGPDEYRGEKGGAPISTPTSAEVIDRRRAPSAPTLAVLAVSGCLAAACAVVVVLEGAVGPEPRVEAAIIGWIVFSYVIGGLIAWWRRPESPFGLLMIAAGFAPLLSKLSGLDADLPYTIGLLFRVMPAVLFLHVFLAYPTGRLERQRERVLLVGAYAAALGLELARMLLGGFGPRNLVEVLHEPGLADGLRRGQVVILAALILAGVGVLFARRRRSGRPLRRSRDVLIQSFSLALVLSVFGLLATNFHGSDFEPARWVAFGMIGVAPIALLLGLLESRLARSSVGDLFVELRADSAPAPLRKSLARALRDPSLRLAYWLPRFQAYVDEDGNPIELTDGVEATSVTPIEREGARVAVLLHDPALDDEPELLTAVTAAAEVALENGRLHAELNARLDELRGSRVRILEAGQKERQRLERDLHDGAQQRLIALSLELSQLEEDLRADEEARARLERARREIGTSLEELRAVAHGIHPAVVTGHGLEVALEQLAARASIPVRLQVDVRGRLPEHLEVAVFYLVSESLANIGKHANATTASVEVARNNGQLIVDVVDDGVGGADTDRGFGLRGLADRVEALEGRLRVWSPTGGGTRLRAEIPCVQ
jgi:signal transduction histidine kinase